MTELAGEDPEKTLALLGLADEQPASSSVTADQIRDIVQSTVQNAIKPLQDEIASVKSVTNRTPRSRMSASVVPANQNGAGADDADWSNLGIFKGRGR